MLEEWLDFYFKICKKDPPSLGINELFVCLYKGCSEQLKLDRTMEQEQKFSHD